MSGDEAATLREAVAALRGVWTQCTADKQAGRETRDVMAHALLRIAQRPGGLGALVGYGDGEWVAVAVQLSRAKAAAVREPAVRLVCVLAGEATAQRCLLAKGGLQRLIKLVSRHEVFADTLAALATLVGECEMHAVIVETCGVNMLIEAQNTVINAALSLREDETGDAPRALPRALQVFLLMHPLIRSAEQARLLVESSLQALLRLAQATSPGMRCEVASIISSLSANVCLQHAIVERAHNTILMLAQSTDATLQRYAACSIANLCSNDRTKVEAVVKIGLAPLQWLARSSSVLVQREVSRAVYHLTRDVNLAFTICRWAAFTGAFDPLPPSPRQGFATCVVGEQLFVLGGQHGAITFNDVYCLTTSSKWRWAKLPTCGEASPARAYASAVCATVSLAAGAPARPHILVFGGKDARRAYNDVYALALDTLEWKRVPTRGTAPAARSGHACALADKGRTMYVFGGNASHRERDQFSEIYTLDLHTMEWSQLLVHGRVAPRDRATWTREGRRLYLVGGFTGGGGSAGGGAPTRVFDLDAEAWLDTSMGGVAPTPRGAHSVVQVGAHLMVVGGFMLNGAQYAHTLHILDTQHHVWYAPRVVGDLRNVCAHRALRVGNQVVVLGGKGMMCDFGVFFLSFERATNEPATLEFPESLYNQVIAILRPLAQSSDPAVKLRTADTLCNLTNFASMSVLQTVVQQGGSDLLIALGASKDSHIRSRVAAVMCNLYGVFAVLGCDLLREEALASIAAMPLSSFIRHRSHHILSNNVMQVTVPPRSVHTYELAVQHDDTVVDWMSECRDGCSSVHAALEWCLGDGAEARTVPLFTALEMSDAPQPVKSRHLARRGTLRFSWTNRDGMPITLLFRCSTHHSHTHAK